MLFLVLETVVAFVLFIMVLQLGFGMPARLIVPVGLGVFNFGALLFLLVVSPLFFRSLGAVAKVGWAIAIVFVVTAKFIH